jgi:hypothetical protein
VLLADGSVQTVPASLIHSLNWNPANLEFKPTHRRSSGSVNPTESITAQTHPMDRAATISAQTNATLGPVIERTIDDYNSGRDWLLNLATGRTFSPPPGLD